MVLYHLTPSTLYVGSFNGVFKSTDGGTTWGTTGLVIPNTTTPADVHALAINPATTGAGAILYAGGVDGAFQTMNGGASWTSLNANFPLQNGVPIPPDISPLVVDPVTPPTLYPSPFPHGLFNSTNS